MKSLLSERQYFRFEKTAAFASMVFFYTLTRCNISRSSKEMHILIFVLLSAKKKKYAAQYCIVTETFFEACALLVCVI